MAHFQKKICFAAIGLMIFGVTLEKKSHAALTVVGNWESGSADGWIDWGNQLSITDPGQNPGEYSFSSTTGVTIGSSSVHVFASGNNQDLSVKLQNIPLAGSSTGDARGAFFTNRAVAVDITYPAQNQPSGYQQLGEFDLNTQHFGYSSPLGAYPVPGTFVGYGNGMGGALPTPDHTFTLSYNYAAQLNINGGPIITSGATTDGWVEFIIDTNGDSTHPDYYFDNFRLYTPGDMNNDGHVNAADIRAMQLALTNPSSYQSTYFNGNANYVPSDLATLGDVNGDGVFNNADLQGLLDTLNTGHGSVSSVPEPASLVLLGFALPAAAYTIRRRSKLIAA
jgi:Dockerin type I domain